MSVFLKTFHKHELYWHYILGENTFLSTLLKYVNYVFISGFVSMLFDLATSPIVISPNLFSSYVTGLIITNINWQDNKRYLIVTNFCGYLFLRNPYFERKCGYLFSRIWFWSNQSRCKQKQKSKKENVCISLTSCIFTSKVNKI